MSFDSFLQEHELTLAVPLPRDHGSAAGGIHALLEQAWATSVDGWKTASDSDGVCVRWGRDPALPVISVEWELDCRLVTLAAYRHFNLFAPPELAAEWDATFISAEHLAEHGSPEALAQGGSFARLVRLRFRATPLADREMLYLVLAAERPAVGGGALLVAYLSVISPRYPPSRGYVRSRNLHPSFDLASVQPDGTLRIRHHMTTAIGGWVPRWLWNSAVFRKPVCTTYAKEARKVREVLETRVREGAALDDK